MRFTHIFLWFLFTSGWACAQKAATVESSQQLTNNIKTGADNTEAYFKLLRNKKVGVVANQSSLIYKTHLVDSLLNAGIKIRCVFAPEHGYKGNVEAGGHVNDEKNKNIEIYSLYGSHKKPTAAQLKTIDILVFDIQDVGVRFYTYISTLQYVMEACADAGIPVLVLDRPNPNGFYIDGPVLDTAFASFVGMQPIPVVHGLTIGEYAKMLVGQNWLNTKNLCKLEVIKCSGYNHQMFYQLPIKPSPNLPNINAVYLYASLCFFEGTPVSVGRGTSKPFQIIGLPDSTLRGFTFTPQKIPSVAEAPMYEGQICYGMDLTKAAFNVQKHKQIQLKWLLGFYHNSKTQSTFFNSFFDKLAGTDILRQQIIAGISETDIRLSWQKDLEHYKTIRNRYLLYDDF